MIPLKRILTRKSKLGFGKWGDYTVQELIDLNKKDILIAPYFKISSIDYVEDILIELGITDEYRIIKPSIDRNMFLKFVHDTKGFEIRKKEKMMPYRTQPLSKGLLKHLNQNR